MILHVLGWKFGKLEKKQKNVFARSSAETQFRAMTQEVCELL